MGDNVLVAWKPSRECARAVAAAVPLMQRARNVQVVLRSMTCAVLMAH